MEPNAVPSGQTELHNFIEFLFGGLHGTAYVAVVNPEDRTQWQQNFFEYPAEVSRMESVILQTTATKEVYVAPALYKSNNADKENFKCSQVVWTEFDGNAPNEENYFAQPSLRVQSSSNENQHIYWKLNTPISNTKDLEKINRDITYALGADSSGWDATQVLRPPSTLNHKRGGTPVRQIVNNSVTYDNGIFKQLPEAPEQIDTANWQLGVLPELTDVILKYEFTPDMQTLFKKEKLDQGTRSTGLMNLAYGLAQMGMSDPEIFVCLISADNRWGKFKDRKDRNKRLAHIITVARHKYPDTNDIEGSDPYAFALDFVTFLNTDIEIDWVIEPMLMDQGTMLLVGPGGIGKTQITLRFLIHLALGKDYWHYKISKPQKILFLSLEMGFGELKKFVESMAKTLSPEDYELLQKNFIVIPHGEKWPLNTPVGQEHLLRMIEDYEPNGIAVDSVGSAIQGSISDDESVMGYIDFIDRVRKKYTLFWWHIHHMRKSTNHRGTSDSQDDIYGNQYLFNRATSSYGVLFGRDGLIKLRNFKNRLHEKEDDFLVKRIENLEFEPINQAVTEQLKHIAYSPKDKEEGGEDLTAGDGKFSI